MGEQAKQRSSSTARILAKNTKEPHDKVKQQVQHFLNSRSVRDIYNRTRGWYPRNSSREQDLTSLQTAIDTLSATESTTPEHIDKFLAVIFNTMLKISHEDFKKAQWHSYKTGYNKPSSLLKICDQIVKEIKSVGYPVHKVYENCLKNFTSNEPGFNRENFINRVKQEYTSRPFDFDTRFMSIPSSEIKKDGSSVEKDNISEKIKSLQINQYDDFIKKIEDWHLTGDTLFLLTYKTLRLFEWEIQHTSDKLLCSLNKTIWTKESGADLQASKEMNATLNKLKGLLKQDFEKGTDILAVAVQWYKYDSPFGQRQKPTSLVDICRDKDINQAASDVGQQSKLRGRHGFLEEVGYLTKIAIGDDNQLTDDLPKDRDEKIHLDTSKLKKYRAKLARKDFSCKIKARILEVVIKEIEKKPTTHRESWIKY